MIRFSETDRQDMMRLSAAMGWPLFDRDAPEVKKPGCDSGPVPCIVENSTGNWFALLERGAWTTFDPFRSAGSAFAVLELIEADYRISRFRGDDRYRVWLFNSVWGSNNPGEIPASYSPNLYAVSTGQSLPRAICEAVIMMCKS